MDELAKLWTADLGNGLYINPILHTDYSDPDVIRVGERYYMTASSFHYVPGLPLLESADLVNWELQGYALPELPGPGYAAVRHSCGVWAPSLRYHEGRFYIYFGMPDEGLYVLSSTDFRGPWSQPRLLLAGAGYIDPCPIWTPEGRCYLIHAYARSRIGFKSFLGSVELEPDGLSVKGRDHLIYDGRASNPTIEGPKCYYRAPYYYIFAPAGGVKSGWQTVLRSRDPLGPFEERVVLRQGSTAVNGPHQGGWVDTPAGQDYFLHFQDCGASGRICHLQPLQWTAEHWPLLGRPRPGETWGEPVELGRRPALPPCEPLSQKLSLQSDRGGLEASWQAAAHRAWADCETLPEGAMRLQARGCKVGENLWSWGSFLSQKIPAPSLDYSLHLDFSGLQPGEEAGLLLLGGSYAALVLRRSAERRLEAFIERGGENSVWREALGSLALNEDCWLSCLLWPEGDRGIQDESLAAGGIDSGLGRQGTELRLKFSIFSSEAGAGSCLWCQDLPLALAAQTWTGVQVGLFCRAPGWEAGCDSGWLDCLEMRSRRPLLTDLLRLRATDCPVAARHPEDPAWMEASWEESLVPLLAREAPLAKAAGLRLLLASAPELPAEARVLLLGDLEACRYMVEYSKSSMQVRPPRGASLLHYAALADRPDMLDYLIRRVGLDPWALDQDFCSLWDYARAAGAGANLAWLEAHYGPERQLYRNPVCRGLAADPSIVRVGEDYYMVHSSFHYFPAIPISKSRDLIHWDIIGHAIVDEAWARLAPLEGGRGYWAADISHDGQYFYITATYRKSDQEVPCREQIVCRSTRPEGPYSEPAIIPLDGIDPSLYHEGGRHYMLLNRGARIVELDADCRRALGEPSLIYYGWNKRNPEGPHLLRRGDYYYLFLAEGGTGQGHLCSVARSRQLMGPYEPSPYNPLLRQSDKQSALQRAGHGKAVELADGRWALVYLCARMAEGYSLCGRETGLDLLEWTADGWPRLARASSCPSGLAPCPFPGTEAQDRYLGCWRQYLQPGILERLALHPRAAARYTWQQGRLDLAPDKYWPGSLEARQLLLLRQDEAQMDFRLQADIRHLAPGAAAGLIQYYDERSWFAYLVEAGADGAWTLYYYRQLGQELQRQKICCGQLRAEALVWNLDIRGLKREFCLCDSSGQKLAEDSLEDCSYLTDEGWHEGKRFTGPTLGCYHYGPSESHFYLEELALRRWPWTGPLIEPGADC